MSKIGESFKKFITADDVDDNKENEGQEEMDEEPTSEYEEPAEKNILKTDARMVIFEPHSYEEGTQIADCLKRHKACVVNIHRLQNEYRQRLIDFLWGTIYAIDGRLQKVGEDVFLCTPKDVTVNGEITEDDSAQA